MSSGTYIDFSRTNLKIENTICEIIDNSMDSCRRSNTKKIHIMFGKDSEDVEIQKEHPEESNPKIVDFSDHFHNFSV